MQRLLFSLVLETCIFLSTRYYRGLPRYFRTQRSSTFFTAAWGSGTTAHGAVLPPRRYYRDDTRYYRAVESAWGLRAGRGSSNSPIPIHSFSSCCLSLSLSPAHEQCRRPLPDLHLRPLSSDSDRWDRSPPLPLAMEQGFSPNPSLFGSFFRF